MTSMDEYYTKIFSDQTDAELSTLLAEFKTFRTLTHNSPSLEVLMDAIFYARRECTRRGVSIR
jgi:hypothetical protein